MHRPSENIHDVRRRGLRWLAGAIVVVILSLIAFLLFVLLDSRFEAIQNSQSAVISTEFSIIENPSNDTNTTPPIIYATSTTSLPPTSTTAVPTAKPVNMISHPFRNVLVSSPIGFCSEIGRNIILQGGNAVDAAIATQFCVGGLHPHSSGIGGELILLLHTGNSTVTVNGQVRSARSVTEHTYASNPKLKDEGYASIAVPGTLHALFSSFRKFGSGRVAWQSLIWPTVEFLERGYPASAELVTLANAHPDRVSLLGEVARTPLKEGDIVKNLDYANTLRKLAQSRDPIHMFYKGDIANQIVNEMKNKGGLITKLDMVSYESTVEEPLLVHFNENFTLAGPPPPSAFAAYQLGVRLTLDSHTSSSNVILKAFQTIGDPTFFPETRMMALNLTTTEFKNFVADLNTSASSFLGESTDISSITVADASGAIASIDSTLYSSFGALRKSEKLGFIWNNGMSAFSLSDDEEDFNSVQGAKRARTRMAPIILLQNNEWRIAAHPHRLLDKTATCIAGLIRPEEITEPCNSVVIENLGDTLVHNCPNNWEAYHCQGTRGF